MATLRSVHSYRTARSSAAEMIEWIRRIVAGLIGLHTCRRHRLSHVWGRVGAVIPERPAPLVAGVLTFGVVLDLREPAAKP